MKGLIFTELIDFVERHTSLIVGEEIISDARLENDGAYTTVGNYPHSEAIQLVEAAAKCLNRPTSDLMRQFGNELFDRLLDIHSHFFAEEVNDAFSFLAGVQNHIHTEVEKLYPGANPPQVQASIEGGHMTVTYESHRPFAMIALGLVEGCCAHFDDTLAVEIQGDLVKSDTRATFTLTKKNTS